MTVSRYDCVCVSVCVGLCVSSYDSVSVCVGLCVSRYDSVSVCVGRWLHSVVCRWETEAVYLQ